MRRTSPRQWRSPRRTRARAQQARRHRVCAIRISLVPGEARHAEVRRGTFRARSHHLCRRGWPRSLGSFFMGERLDGVRIALRSNHQFSQLRATAEGLGISELPCFLADQNDGVERVWPDEKPAPGLADNSRRPAPRGACPPGLFRDRGGISARRPHAAQRTSAPRASISFSTRAARASGPSGAGYELLHNDCAQSTNFADLDRRLGSRGRMRVAKDGAPR